MYNTLIYSLLSLIMFHKIFKSKTVKQTFFVKLTFLCLSILDLNHLDVNIQLGTKTKQLPINNTCLLLLFVSFLGFVVNMKTALGKCMGDSTLCV